MLLPRLLISGQVVTFFVCCVAFMAGRSLERGWSNHLGPASQAADAYIRSSYGAFSHEPSDTHTNSAATPSASSRPIVAAGSAPAIVMQKEEDEGAPSSNQVPASSHTEAQTGTPIGAPTTSPTDAPKTTVARAPTLTCATETSCDGAFVGQTWKRCSLARQEREGGRD